MLESAGLQPRKNPAQRAWSDLAAAVRRAGRKPDSLSLIARQAKTEGLAPPDLTPAWVAGLLAQTPEAKLKATRSACYLLDELRDDARIPAALLPRVGTGVPRRYARRRQS